MEATTKYLDRSDLSLMRDVTYGNYEAFAELMDRYLALVSRTSFRILCDRNDSESITVDVFVSLWHDVFDYDDRFTLGEWLLKKTYDASQKRMIRRRILSIFGVHNDIFVNVAASVKNENDYHTKLAWELHCRAVSRMTVFQSTVYALRVLENLPQDSVAAITGARIFKVRAALKRAEEKVREELKEYGRYDDYGRYVGFLRKVAENLTDKSKLSDEIMEWIGVK